MAILSLVLLTAATEPSIAMRKDAATRVANEILAKCKRTEDARMCLETAGATCEPVYDGKPEEHLCHQEISIEFAKLGSSNREPVTDDAFDVTYRIYKRKDNWKTRVQRVVPVDQS